jgi:hypothetical protein
MKAQLVYVSGAGPLAISEAAAPDAPLMVVADFADESYVPVRLPKLGWRDRRSLLRRRLAQDFADTSYRLALPLAGPKHGQGETHVLAAVPAEALERLTQPALAAGREIAGVWTVSLLAAWWLRRARVPPRIAVRGLVVVRTPAGVRHVFLSGGLPTVSRLVAEDIGGDGAPDHGRELERTVQYLRNARLLGGEERVPAWAWGVPLDDRAPDAGRGALHWQSGPILRGLPDVQAQGLPALLALLARKPPRTQFAPDSVRRHWWARRTANAVYAVAAVSAALAVAAAAALALDARAAEEKARRIAQDIGAVEERLAEVRARFERAGVAPETASAAVAAYDAHLRREPQPHTALRLLAQAFSAAPTWRLDELRWSVANEAGTEERAPCAQPAQGRHAAIVQLRGATREVGLREIAADRARFEARVRGSPGVTFTAEQAPLALDGQALRGGGDAPRSQPFAYCVRVPEAS